MKKNNAFIFLIISYCFLLLSCNTATPENYFDIAVLNVNLLTGFASDGLARELESPSEKLIEGTKDQSAPMKRKEIIDDKIKFVKENFEKLKNLKVTDDARDILQASNALHKYVLPVYEKEYSQLAKLYDSGAPKEQVTSLTELINKTYFPQFEKKLNTLTAAGKLFATRHNILVHWPEN